jgi:hypothetical protein
VETTPFAQAEARTIDGSDNNAVKVESFQPSSTIAATIFNACRRCRRHDDARPRGIARLSLALDQSAWLTVHLPQSCLILRASFLLAVAIEHQLRHCGRGVVTDH